jgi:FkbM family methyltransferase
MNLRMAVAVSIIRNGTTWRESPLCNRPPCDMRVRLPTFIQGCALYGGLKTFWHRRRFFRLSLADKTRLRFYSQFIQPGHLVFDVGANMGNRSKIFLRLGAEVVAFEPQVGCADFLRLMFRNRPEFHLVAKALGPAEGKALMFVSESHTISSLSERWIKATVNSGRFVSQKWPRREEVEVTTLDLAITQFGLPSFIKIDVEGFELEVLRGLSQSVANISFEVLPEYLENTYCCLQRLDDIAEFYFQFSFGESMRFALPRWISANDIRAWLKSLPRGSFGDLYARRARAQP